jgi:hypothetical protein
MFYKVLAASVVGTFCCVFALSGLIAPGAKPAAPMQPTAASLPVTGASAQAGPSSPAPVVVPGQPMSDTGAPGITAGEPMTTPDQSANGPVTEIVAR